VRAEAAIHAGAAGEAVIREMVRSPDRETAIAALRSLPETALELAASRLSDEDPSIRAATLETYARGAAIPPLPEDALFAIAEDPDPRIRRAGILLLANLEEPEAIAAIAGAIGDSSAEVQFAAETVLGSLDDAGVLAVEPLLRAQRERTVRSALRVVSLVGTPAARSILKGELRHRVRDLWSGIIAVSRLPAEPTETAKSFLRMAYQDDIMRSRRIAFAILELLANPNTVRWVDKVLHQGSLRARGDALEVLSHLGDRQAAQLLVLAHERGRLEDKIPEVLGVVAIPADDADIVANAGGSDGRWIQMAAKAITSPETSRPEEEELMENLLALKQVPLFAQLSFEQLEAIQKLTRAVEYLPNEPIVKEGDPGGELFLLVEGRVRVFKNFGRRDERCLATQQAVSYFGEMAAIDDEPRSATVIAAERSRMLCLDGESLKELIRQMPEIALQIMRVLTARVRRAESASVG
jgi:HEAT repeat protein